MTTDRTLAPIARPPLSPRIAIAVALLALALATATALALATATAPAGEPASLTMDAAIEMALRQNPEILSARKEILHADGVLVEVRAEIVPKARFAGSYNEQDPSLLEVPDLSAMGGLSGFDSFFAQNRAWQISLQASQLLFSGGRALNSIQAARRGRDASFWALRETVENVVAETRSQFNRVLLDRSLISVQEESVSLLEKELEDQTRRFKAGTVPQFNVLRAEVELSNARPDLIRARNEYRLANLRLLRTLGLNVQENDMEHASYNCVGDLTYRPAKVDPNALRALAQTRRSNLKRHRQEILAKASEVKVALSGYFPRIEAVAGAEARNSRLSNELDVTVQGWFVGLNGQWNIFDGLATHGRTRQARADLEKAKIAYDDAVRRVDLEVLQAHSRFIEAVELIASQTKNVEQAKEALRLAQARFDAGAGTQLELFDSRVALTRARTTELRAQFDYLAALIELDRVTSAATGNDRTFADPLLEARWARELIRSIEATPAQERDK